MKSLKEKRVKVAVENIYEKIICSVPRTKFLAMEMKSFYVTVDEREKLLNDFEKQIKRECKKDVLLAVEQLLKRKFRVTLGGTITCETDVVKVEDLKKVFGVKQ